MQLRCAPIDAAVGRHVDALDLAVSAPRQPADFVQSRRSQRFLGAGEGYDRLGFVDPGEAAGFSIRHQVGVFRCLLAREGRLIADFEPAQIFDVDAAFPAGNDQPQRIALFGPQRLAVLAVGHETIVETLVERQAAVHARGVGAFGQDPFGFFLETDFVEQGRQLDAGPLRAADHAVRELQRVELCAAPFHAAVGRTLDEINPRDGRKAHDVVHRQYQRPFDKAVDQEAVLMRIDVGAAAMVALEEQSIGRNNAL